MDGQFEGTQDIRLSAALESASNPQFSPDGRYVSFLAARGADSKRQIHLLDRRGGEAQPVTAMAGEISSYDWSSDGRLLALSASPGDGSSDKVKTPKPIVIDGLRFKEDVEGYLTSADRGQLYIVDALSKQVTPLTVDKRYADTMPVWSPDGRRIAFFSDRGTDEARSGMLGLYVIDARAGAEPRKLAEFFAPNKRSLSWTHDGTRLLYATGLEPRLNAYIQDRLTIIDVSGGKPKVLTERLDRALSYPVISPDDSLIHAIVEDDGSEVPAVLRLETGNIENRLSQKLSATSLCGGGGHVAVVASTDYTVPEVYALEAGAFAS